MTAANIAAPVSDAQLIDDVRVLRAALAAGPTPGPWSTISRGSYWSEEEADVRDADGSDVAGAEFVQPIGDNDTTRGQLYMRDAAYIAAASPDRIARVLCRLEQEQDARRKRLHIAIAAAHENADPVDVVAAHRRVSREEAAALMRAALEQPAAGNITINVKSLPPEFRLPMADVIDMAAEGVPQPAASGAQDEPQRLQALVQQMQRTLIRVETDWTDGHGGAFEDGEMGAMDDVRAVLADVPADLRPVGYVLRYGALDMGVCQMEPHDTAEAARAAGQACDFNYEVLPVFRGAALAAAPAAQPANLSVNWTEAADALSWLGCTSDTHEAMAANPGRWVQMLISGVLESRDKTRAARAAGAAPAAAQPWTPVVEGLPEPGEDVLACSEDALFAGLRVVVRRIVDSDGDHWLLDTGDGTREVRNVTAWMKLPPEFGAAAPAGEQP